MQGRLIFLPIDIKNMKYAYICTNLLFDSKGRETGFFFVLLKLFKTQYSFKNDWFPIGFFQISYDDFCALI